ERFFRLAEGFVELLDPPLEQVLVVALEAPDEPVERLAELLLERVEPLERALALLLVGAGEEAAPLVRHELAEDLLDPRLELGQRLLRDRDAGALALLGERVLLLGEVRAELLDLLLEVEPPALLVGLGRDRPLVLLEELEELAPRLVLELLAGRPGHMPRARLERLLDGLRDDLLDRVEPEDIDVADALLLERLERRLLRPIGDRAPERGGVVDLLARLSLGGDGRGR